MTDKLTDQAIVDELAGMVALGGVKGLDAWLTDLRTAAIRQAALAPAEAVLTRLPAAHHVLLQPQPEGRGYCLAAVRDVHGRNLRVTHAMRAELAPLLTRVPQHLDTDENGRALLYVRHA